MNFRDLVISYCLVRFPPFCDFYVVCRFPSIWCLCLGICEFGRLCFCGLGYWFMFRVLVAFVSGVWVLCDMPCVLCFVPSDCGLVVFVVWCFDALLCLVS